jgi:hypothetical protein
MEARLGRDADLPVRSPRRLGEHNDMTAANDNLVRELRRDIEAWEKDVDAPNPEVIRQN